MEGWSSGAAFLLVEQVQVEVHLAGVFRLERPDLQFEGHQCFQEAVVEQEVDEILLAPERQAVLAADETEAVAELEQEIPQAGSIKRSSSSRSLTARPTPRNSRL